MPLEGNWLIVCFTAERIIWLQKQMPAVTAALNNEALEVQRTLTAINAISTEGFLMAWNITWIANWRCN